VPTGQPADAETVAGVTATVRELLACFNAGDIGRAAALHTEAFLRRQLAAIPPEAFLAIMTAPPSPPREQAVLHGVRDVRVLPDGRAGAFADIYDPVVGGDATFYFTFAKVGDRWLSDEEVILPFGATGTPATPAAGTPAAADPEANKALIRRFVQAVYDRHDPTALDEFIAPLMVDYTAPPGVPPGLAGARRGVTQFLTAFPDLHVEVEDIIAERDFVVVRITESGTHQGELAGLPPTGRRASWPGMWMFRIANGQIVERWVIVDIFSLLVQLGFVPAPGEAGATPTAAAPPAAQGSPAVSGGTDASASSEEIARRYVEAVLGAADMAAANALIAPDAAFNLSGAITSGPAAPLAAVAPLLAAFPDARFTVEEVVVEGDRVAVRWRFGGTHQADFLGVPATGNQVSMFGITLLRVAGGQIAEAWTVQDTVGLLTQLGVLGQLTQLNATPAAGTPAP
jgi:steroid delta-isomerase-like uncharacterized protein